MNQSQIIAPSISPNDEQITIVKIYFKQNSYVKKDDILFEFESTKTSIQYNAEANGYFYTYQKEGDNVNCGSVIGVISQEIVTEQRKEKFNDFSITKKAEELIEENNLNIEIFKDKEIITEADVKKCIKSKSKNKIEKNFDTNDFIIVGAGSHGKVVHDALISNSFNVGCFIDYSSNNSLENFCEIPVFNLEDIEVLKKNGAKNIYINTNDINLTKKIYNKCKELNFEFPAIVHNSACVSPSVKLNDCSFIGPNVVLGPDVSIGKFTKILNSSTVAHGTKIGNYSQISDGSTIAGNVNIGDNCLIGIKVAVINKVMIKNNVIVSSGNTIIKNIEDNDVIKISK